MSFLSKLAFSGLGIATLIVGIAFFFMNPEQCPEQYTQAQADASSCIVGANIGLGIMMMLAAIIGIVSCVLAAIAAYRHNRK
jgi:hypothetical protein